MSLKIFNSRLILYNPDISITIHQLSDISVMVSDTTRVYFAAFGTWFVAGYGIRKAR